jgi:sugar-phosphatase
LVPYLIVINSRSAFPEIVLVLRGVRDCTALIPYRVRTRTRYSPIECLSTAILRNASPPVRYHFTMTVISVKAMLFDLDGVLIDSTPAVARVWTQWAIEHGFEPEKTVREAHGRPSIESIRELLPNADHHAENREVERREIEDTGGVVPLPGALVLLSSLPPNRWAIVTSCTRPLAEVRIRAAGLPVPQTMITSSDITNGKPHPEPYIKGAQALGFAPSDCLVVEDVPAGIRSGTAAGARVIALRTTLSDADLIAAGADWLLDNCSGISAEDDVQLRALRVTLC